MKRLLKILVLVLVAGGSAAAQTAPSQIYYRLANQHTYMITPYYLDWHTSRAYARSFGGYLASVNDSSEQDFLAASYAGSLYPCWIGLNDAATEGVYVWDSGEPVNYINWCAGEPNNFGGDEDHVEMFAVHTGFSPCWNDSQSPYTGTGIPSTRGIVELAHGIRVNFDGTSTACGSSPFPTPLGATSDPDGISWNGAGASSGRYASVTSLPEFGMPVTGTKYLRIPTDGQVDLANGPFPRPAPATVNEVRIAIPAGTKGVSFAYEFVTTETAPFNDGMDVAVVDGNGNVVTRLVYKDVVNSNYGVVESTVNHCLTVISGLELLPMGPNTVAEYLPVLPYPAYLSIVAWNGSDDSVPSAVHVDAIQFWGTGKLQLDMSAPFGAGSIRVANSQGTPNTPYWTAFTVVPGAFPNGWLFGLDITLNDLLSQIAFGTPFSGTLDASGGSVFELPAGVPAGIPLYAVSVQLGSEITASAPQFFVTQ